MVGILEAFEKIVGTLVNHDVIDTDYRAIAIDESVRQQTQKYSTRYRASQRIGKGLFYTDAEKKAEIERMRERPLP